MKEKAKELSVGDKSVIHGCSLSQRSAPRTSETRLRKLASYVALAFVAYLTIATECLESAWTQQATLELDLSGGTPTRVLVTALPAACLTYEAGPDVTVQLESIDGVPASDLAPLGGNDAGTAINPNDAVDGEAFCEAWGSRYVLLLNAPVRLDAVGLRVEAFGQGGCSGTPPPVVELRLEELADAD